MNINEIKLLPLNKLINILDIALQNNDQELVNTLAYELTCRLYVPNQEVNFDELLFKFGYKEVKKKILKK